MSRSRPRPRIPRALRPVAVAFSPAGVCVLRSLHGKGFRMEPTCHDYLKILLVFSGEGTLRSATDPTSRPLSAGDAAVVPPGCVHWLRDRRPLSLYVVCFQRSAFVAGYEDAICGSGEVPRVIPGAASKLLDQARRLLHEQGSDFPAAEAMCRGLAWQFLAALARLPGGAEEMSRTAAMADPTGSRARVRRAAEELRHGFYEAWSLDEAARRAGLARRRFSQLFVELHGRTWWEALQAARLDHAEVLLRDFRRSVATVAFECGYGDLSGFYRAWKSRWSASPRVWRLSAR